MDTEEASFDLVCDLLEFTQIGGGEISVKNVSNDRMEAMEDTGDDNSAMRELQAENFAFIRNQKAKSTLKKTENHKNRFVDYLLRVGETRQPEEIIPRSLDVYLSTYIRNLVKFDGTDYEPDSITSIYGSIDRHLREQSYSVSIMDSGEFKNSRDMVEAKRKALKASGKGNKPNSAVSLTNEEIEILWSRGGFGHDHPEQLTSTVWFLLSLHFGFRGAHESRQLRVGDVRLKVDCSGDKYLECSERLSKTRVGLGNPRTFNPKAWATGGVRCPVKTYEVYQSHKPVKMLITGKPFYLAVNNMRKAHNPIWYSAAPLGHNSIQRLMKLAGLRAGIARNLTNHVVRKTSITALVQAAVPYGMVAQHSGHRSVDSIKHYAVASMGQQKSMSAILSHQAVSINSK